MTTPGAGFLNFRITKRARSIYNFRVMKKRVVIFALGIGLVACNKASAPPVSPGAAGPKVNDAVSQKLADYAGASATNCGRLSVQASADASKTVADCAMQASQGKHPFYVAYDMPGMAVGVAGNANGKLFTVQSQGSGASAAVTAGDCPSELRVASSGRVTCFAPGDMGSMSGSHAAGAMVPGTTNPHGMANPHGAGTNPHTTAPPSN